MEYYIQIDETAFGPLTEERIRRLLELKKINESTVVSTDAHSWRKLGSFPGLVKSGRTSHDAYNLQSLPQTPAPNTSSDLWNYSLDGSESVGPISYSELSNLVKMGFLRPDTIIWKEGGKESLRIQDHPEFQALLPQAKTQHKNVFSRLFGKGSKG